MWLNLHCEDRLRADGGTLSNVLFPPTKQPPELTGPLTFRTPGRPASRRRAAPAEFPKIAVGEIICY